MNCSCCMKKTNRLTVRPSLSLPGQRVYLCDSCKDQAHEPRWAIVLSMKFGKTKKFSLNALVEQRMYCGPEISIDCLRDEVF